MHKMDDAQLSPDDRDIYEAQLSQLQEQLVSAMIENQILASKITDFDKTGRFSELETEVNTLQSENDTLRGELNSIRHSITTEEATEQQVVQDESQKQPDIYTRLFTKMQELLADLEPLEEDGIEEIDDQVLAVKTLRVNVERFGVGLKFISDVLAGVQYILTWKNFLFTLTVFLEETESKPPIKVSEKFNLVIQVARKVQNILGHLADAFEKLNNLLTWQQPKATRRIMVLLMAAFVLSTFLPLGSFITLSCIAFGFKIFVQNALYQRFPRLKRKYDSSYRLWQSLPNAEQLEALKINDDFEFVEPPDETNTMVYYDEISERFQLPSTETSWPNWADGRKCALIDKSKGLLNSWQSGRLYLTNNYLCFAPHSKGEPLAVALSDVTAVHRGKPFKWMPGSGMSVVVNVKQHNKPLVFGALLNREEAFVCICAAGSKQQLAWALTPSDTVVSVQTLSKKKD